MPDLVRLVHDRERGGLVGLGTEVHGAEAQAADAETGTTEMGEVHGGQPRRVRRDGHLDESSGEAGAGWVRGATGGSVREAGGSDRPDVRTSARFAPTATVAR